MSFTDALRNSMEIEPYETREQFMLRYAGMRPVGENMTLAQWTQQIAMASSLGLSQNERSILWDGTLYHMHQAMAAAIGFASKTNAFPQPDVEMAMTMALVGHQENLRATRLHAGELVAGIVDIHPETLAPLIVQDMQKAHALYDTLQQQQHARERH